MTDRRLCLALDVSTVAAAVAWVRRTSAVFSVYKVGLQLFAAHGPEIIHAVRAAGAREIFLDLKLHDIPNTVAAAVRALCPVAPEWLSLHTGGGLSMLQAAVEAAPPGTRLLGVTVLTSLDASSLAETGVAASVSELVAARAALARRAGCVGVVCAAGDAASLRVRLGSEAELVVPGLRFSGAASQDQRRTATPGAALRAGASMLVIGRALTAAADPDAALAQLQIEVRP